MRKKHIQMGLLVLVFLVPPLLSYVLFFSGYRPEGSVNHGELVDPARPVEQDAGMRTVDGEGFRFDGPPRKWTLFYLGVFSVVITPETSIGVTAILIAIMQSMCLLFWIFFVYTLDRPAIRHGIERVQTTVHRVFGVLLVALGIRVMLMDR